MLQNKESNKGFTWKSVGRFLLCVGVAVLLSALIVTVFFLLSPLELSGGPGMGGLGAALAMGWVVIISFPVFLLASRVYLGRQYLEESWKDSIGYAVLYMILVSILGFSFVMLAG